MNAKDFSQMSDDEFLEKFDEVVESTSQEEEKEVLEDNSSGQENTNEEQIEADLNTNVNTPTGEETEETINEENKEENQLQEVNEEQKVAEKEENSNNANKEPVINQEDVNKNTTSDLNYEEFYKKVTAPLKANGKTIEIKSPEEAIQLMQMGANYTQKMQSIAPYRKLLLMLEKNQLLDEDKLSYLIDVDKKNPDAIKKLVKEAGIDPLDIDTSKEIPYQVGNHKVSDEDVRFTTTLETLQMQPDSVATLTEINTRWDQASKNVLWNDPDVMLVIHEQRQNGIYDQIASEIDRRKALGQIQSTVPFIQAYKMVGDELSASGSLIPRNQIQQQRAPIATTVAKPKTVVNGNDGAKAAMQTRSTTRPAKPIVNPLAMSDEEFMKQFNLNV